MENNSRQNAQIKATFQDDPALKKLAEIYADALMEACEEQKVSTDEIWEEYSSFVEQVCDAFPDFEEILVSGKTPVDEKYRIFDEICVGKTELFCNFLKTLAKRGRLNMIRPVQLAFDEKRTGRVSIRVLSAVPLDAASEDVVRASMRSLIKREPKFSIEVDPRLIGGFIARVGDTVYDASIATQLEQARQEILSNRNVQ